MSFPEFSGSPLRLYSLQKFFLVPNLGPMGKAAFQEERRSHYKVRAWGVPREG